MNIDPNARYSKTQEWVRKDGSLIVYGITHHAQEELSDIVFIELPEVGASFKQGDVVGAIESVKAASDLILPMSGTIAAVNEGLSSKPEVINSSPYQDGWMLKIQPSHPEEWETLMTAEAYGKSLGE
jgi:glycine cleavage system H protein